MTRADLEALAKRCETELGPGVCWPWRTGKKGRIWIDGKIHLVSRVMLARKLGRPLKPGMFACHTCDNPPCFNPAHLYEGTHQDNMRDMTVRRRYFAATQPERCRQIGIINGAKNDWAKGEANPKAALTAKQVADIRASPLGPRALAREYSVDRTTIQRIRRGVLWTAQLV